MQIGVQLNGKLLINAADELLLFGFGCKQLIQSIEQNDLKGFCLCMGSTVCSERSSCPCFAAALTKSR